MAPRIEENLLEVASHEGLEAGATERLVLEIVEGDRLADRVEVLSGFRPWRFTLQVFLE